MPLCAVSVDLDEIPNYTQIHGLKNAEVNATAVYDVGVARLREWARGLGIPLTLFVIGTDLAREKAVHELSGAIAEGDEISNHSLSHRYDLTRLPESEMEAEIIGGRDRIQEKLGVRPVGFRAPGYVITDEVFEVLRRAEVLYDSSVFPCPSYQLAKAGIISGMSLLGRTSRSVIDTPQILRAPIDPYRVGEPYWRKGSGVLELPIQVTRRLRLPFIGTSVTGAGPGLARRLALGCLKSPLVNFELHGIDVLDRNDGLEALAPYQRDVRVPLARKLKALTTAVETLRAGGYKFVTMKDAARTFA